MAEHSGIEWTESTWNPLTGCTKISPGCKHCYAERMAKRLHAMGQPNYVNGFKLTMHENVLEKPLEWKKPQVIFVNSMSDLFHKDVPFEFIEKVFDVMKRAHWHQFQVLTKRAERVAQLSHRRKITFRIRSMLTKQVGHDQVYCRTASHEN
ncbi:MAG: phage Gp37/Gp68 family protein, partial [Anaerolineae bacterium]|nr:phage Gp37/Gp68 family protein [Anaerolineae bacterium]